MEQGADERDSALTESKKRKPVYVLSLDLGQAADYTALSINQVLFPEIGPGIDTMRVQTRHLERYPLRTPYPEIVASVGQRVEQVKPMGRAIFAVDHTGVGRPVVDMFRAARLSVQIVAITITSGGKAHYDKLTREYHVPKKDLIGSLMAMAHAERYAIAAGLDEARALTEELKEFRMKITASANMTFDAWREGKHDDLVLSVAMGCWVAERFAVGGGVY